ncbi:UNVERIFIED_CONTAM: hypothetical protein PYX00_005310 [Menopon gallinae]|uniref:Gag-like protein n=1 Tax=Menopon gallinae TaxID=328185 RepID=A0AAW2HQS5_9NEOP
MEESSEDIEDLDIMCSLYISPVAEQDSLVKVNDEENSCNKQTIGIKQLQALLKSYKLVGKWNILKTSCGFLISFTNEVDADHVIGKNISGIFGPMQIVRLHGRRSLLRQAVFLREVPWAIQLNDLKEALVRQGITSARVERKRHHVRVEVCEPEHYETLLRRGLNFFGVIRFQAIPDRGMRSHHSWHDPTSTLSSDPNFVLQCYRCQGFWHIAANCRHEVRCVRCGDHHSVQFCPRPRSNPICCHCSGPHHAAYRHCPVRLDLVNAVPVSLTLSTRRAPNRYLPYPRN